MVPCGVTACLGGPNALRSLWRFNWPRLRKHERRPLVTHKVRVSIPRDPIALYSSQLPTCAFTEIAIVKARRETWMVSHDAAVTALRSKARELGGDALVRLAFGDNGEVTGTVIRFARDDCKQ